MPRKPFCAIFSSKLDVRFSLLFMSAVILLASCGHQFPFIVKVWHRYDTAKVIVFQTWAWSQEQNFPLVEPFFPLLLYWKLVIFVSLETHVQGSASLGSSTTFSLRRCI